MCTNKLKLELDEDIIVEMNSEKATLQIKTAKYMTLGEVIRGIYKGEIALPIHVDCNDIRPIKEGKYGYLIGRGNNTNIYLAIYLIGHGALCAVSVIVYDKSTLLPDIDHIVGYIDTDGNYFKA